MDDVAIKTVNLYKRYSAMWSGKVTEAVKDLNLEVHRGEIFGFLGPNGAGKTTTIKILLGIIYPTSGEAYALGKPAGDPETHYRLSYLPENPYFYDFMTGREILDFYAQLFSIQEPERTKRINALLDRVGLTAAANQQLRSYSKGMQQRIGLAQTLLNDPELLILDEPTAGLDPIAHIDIRDMILDLKSQGKTLFISSHQLSDVEAVCDRVAILKQGKMETLGRLDELLKGSFVEITADGIKDESLPQFQAFGGKATLHSGRLILEQPDDDSVSAAIDAIRAQNGKIHRIVPHRRKLEDLFLETIQGKEEAS
ncbi:MAG: ABC transporter ATP-binding protein [Armatimonadetes bacterium]|nr:ABC transporter ATP-binding protein [Armatimonadota bacterium]